MAATRLAIIHEQILRVLQEKEACYANPICSEMLGETLHLTPSYVREQVQVLQNLNLVGVRRGRGGGYFLRDFAIQVRPGLARANRYV